MDCVEKIKSQLLQTKIPFCCNEPLAHHTSFEIGGPAAVFCKPVTTDQLVQAVNLARQTENRYYLLGKGSNLLFSDKGFAGVVISTTDILPEMQINGTTITANAGASLKKVCELALENELTGVEFAYGIPGSLGGAVYMNAGAYGGETKDVLLNVEFLDHEGNVHTWSAEKLELGYRTSIFARTGWCILRATFQLSKGDSQAIRLQMEDLMQRRKDKQPLELPSAGSAFKRPEGAFAGGLIDQCGLRGFRVGGAAISEKHCGFIVNLGNATCEDVLELARQVSETVKKETGFVLEKEIRVVE